MPELPEVETVRRGLVAAIRGRRLARVTVRRRDLRFPLPREFSGRLAGRRVTAIARRGKFLLLHLDDGWVLLIHLGMSGRIKLFPAAATEPPLEAHDHVIFETDAGAAFRFNDARRFGFMDLCRADALSRHPRLSRLGPEPLEDGFDGASLAARLAGRRTSLKSALGDQTVVAGLGNIYVSESLFRAGLSPKRRADTVRGARAARLVEAIRAVLQDAIAAGGSTLRDHRQPNGEIGYFQHRFAVYGRAGQPCPGCRCDVGRSGGIRQIVQSGRSTFYCAARQR